MKNALEVLKEIERWWFEHSPLDRVPRTPANAIQKGITWLYNQSYHEYVNMTQESSKQAHFRSMFTVWKAVVARMSGYPFFDPNVDGAKAFVEYLEKTVPDQFLQLVDKNIFLGVKFTEAEKARFQQLRQAFIGHGQGKVPPRKTMTPYANTFARR